MSWRPNAVSRARGDALLSQGRRFSSAPAHCMAFRRSGPAVWPDVCLWEVRVPGPPIPSEPPVIVVPRAGTDSRAAAHVGPAATSGPSCESGQRHHVLVAVQPTTSPGRGDTDSSAQTPGWAAQPCDVHRGSTSTRGSGHGQHFPGVRESPPDPQTLGPERNPLVL